MKKLGYFLLFPVLLAAVSFVMTSCGDDDDNDYTPPPSAYTEALTKLFPDASGVKWEVKGSYKVAEFKKGMVDYDVWFDNSAAWAMTEMDYGKDLFLIPDNKVTAAFPQGKYGTWTIDDITHYKQKANEFYVFEVEKAGEADVTLFYSTEGTLLKEAPTESVPDILPDTSI